MFRLSRPCHRGQKVLQVSWGAGYVSCVPSSSPGIDPGLSFGVSQDGVILRRYVSVRHILMLTFKV